MTLLPEDAVARTPPCIRRTVSWRPVIAYARLTLKAIGMTWYLLELYSDQDTFSAYLVDRRKKQFGYFSFSIWRSILASLPWCSRWNSWGRIYPRFWGSLIGNRIRSKLFAQASCRCCERRSGRAAYPRRRTSPKRDPGTAPGILLCRELSQDATLVYKAIRAILHKEE